MPLTHQKLRMISLETKPVLQVVLSCNPLDTRRRFNVYKTSIRRRRRLIDVVTMLCVNWEFSCLYCQLKQISYIVLVFPLLTLPSRVSDARLELDHIETILQGSF